MIGLTHGLTWITPLISGLVSHDQVKGNVSKVLLTSERVTIVFTEKSHSGLDLAIKANIFTFFGIDCQISAKNIICSLEYYFLWTFMTFSSVQDYFFWSCVLSHTFYPCLSCFSWLLVYMTSHPQLSPNTLL